MNAPWFEGVPAQVARLGDKAFFERNLARRYFARRFTQGDNPLPPNTPFAGDETGLAREINLVIVKRIDGGRMRALFATSCWPSLGNDQEIVDFLRSRGIDPGTLKSLAQI